MNNTFFKIQSSVMDVCVFVTMCVVGCRFHFVGCYGLKWGEQSDPIIQYITKFWKDFSFPTYFTSFYIFTTFVFSVRPVFLFWGRFGGWGCGYAYLPRPLSCLNARICIFIFVAAAIYIFGKIQKSETKGGNWEERLGMGGGFYYNSLVGWGGGGGGGGGIGRGSWRERGSVLV